MEESKVRAEIRKVLEGSESLTPRLVKETVAKNLGIDDIDKWKPVIQDELKPYLPDKSNPKTPESTKRKASKEDNSPREAKTPKLESQKNQTKTPASEKKSAKKPDNGSENEDFIKLSNNRRASVSEFKGRKLLNLREYYEKDGEMLPGKKGISLTEPQAKELLHKVDELSAGLESNEEASHALGNRRKASVSAYKGKWSIDVREFYEKDGKELPGTKGLSMPADQWNLLKDNLKDLVEQL